MMKSFPLIVSYYTKNSIYQLVAENLLQTCQKWNLEYLIEPIECLGSWEKNCAYKPLFLLLKIDQLKRPLFWVDADAVFLKAPRVLPQFCDDFAVRLNAEWDDNHPSKVMSGSVYVNATEGGKRVLKLWAKECLTQLTNPQRDKEVWDQIALRDVILKGVPGAVIRSLPDEYTAVLNHPHDKKMGPKAVIGHLQASRGFKKIINEGKST